MSESKSRIIYTLTDEAPLLATCAFLPIIRTFTGPAGVEVETSDISVSARILADPTSTPNERYGATTAARANSCPGY